MFAKAPTLGWHNFDLKNGLLAKFSLPAFDENDANATALAELSFGGRVQRSLRSPVEFWSWRRKSPIRKVIVLMSTQTNISADSHPGSGALDYRSTRELEDFYRQMDAARAKLLKLEELEC
jgi:hypothetical protein